MGNGWFEGGSVGEKGVCGLRKKMKKKSFLRKQGNYLQMKKQSLITLLFFIIYST